MLIKKIVSICTKNGIVRKIQDDDFQWLGDGVGFYPLTDVLDFTEKSFCAVFDIPQKKADKMHFSFDETVPEGFNFGDSDAEEVQTEFEFDVSIVYGGKCLMPIKASDGIAYLDKAYFQPIADRNEDITYIFERHSESGTQFFVIKVGLVVVAVILPFNRITEQFSDTLKNISLLTRVKLENMKELKKIGADEK